MADRLTAAGLIHRRVNPANRREEIAAVVACMPADQRIGLVAALRAFTDAGEEPPADAPDPTGLAVRWD